MTLEAVFPGDFVFALTASHVRIVKNAQQIAKIFEAVFRERATCQCILIEFGAVRGTWERLPRVGLAYTTIW